MRALVGIVIGGVIALAVACGGAAPQKTTAPPPPGGDASSGMVAPASPRAEIDRLDAEIAAQMEKLGEPRPQPMAAPPAPTTCTPSTSPTCTDTCTLKDSICTNADRICELAQQLGGSDAYANDKCERGKASCEAAKQRCCKCV